MLEAVTTMRRMITGVNRRASPNPPTNVVYPLQASAKSLNCRDVVVRTKASVPADTHVHTSRPRKATSHDLPRLRFAPDIRLDQNLAAGLQPQAITEMPIRFRPIRIPNSTVAGRMSPFCMAVLRGCDAQRTSNNQAQRPGALAGGLRMQTA